ncbi:MAG: S-methyl-5-thioribose-1-phosphate isomerase [Caldilineaceae bacterium]|nr:S-methyl-5-thioribose-1-phosphate isomerase [Caldilineaceae bacterium]
MSAYRSIEWRGDSVRLLDQRRLPHETVYLDFTDHASIADAIRSMVIRGAPAIGAAAAYGLALTAARSDATDAAALRAELAHAADVLAASRPTAVNLFWAIKRMQAVIDDPALTTVDQLRVATLAEADAIAADDVWTNKQIGLNAMELVPNNATIIHHCNTGSLATVDYGTALGVIRTAHEQGKNVHAYLDETRPRLQGASLSAWELLQLGVPHTVIVDGASGHIMRTRGVDLCVVGCDRVAANGDTANKIGTYNLALVAHAHGVPFYVAAPTSTIDLATPTGDDIAIEERPAAEVTTIGGVQVTPDGANVANPAFDVTPAQYITAIITEMGIAYPPYTESLAALVAAADARRSSA